MILAGRENHGRSIPIGFLFGFFLERSDLCGSSAFSEIVLMKDARKLWGLWVAIVVSMVMFAAGSALGWIELNPKPLTWAGYLVGGLLFGVGIVLAGGCVSGTLFKSGQGNLNSMAALVGIPLGISAVAYGPIQGLNRMLKSHLVTSADGRAVTLSSVTGLPYWALAALIAALTIGFGVSVMKRRAAAPARSSAPGNDHTAEIGERIFTRSWKPWQSGVAIGLLALVAYTSSAASGRNYPLGVTHGVLDVMVLATDAPVRSVWTAEKKAGPENPPAADSDRPKKHIVWWLVGLVVFLVIGSFTSARLRGSFRFLPKPPDEMVVAFFGGILLGAGATLAGGCVIGNILSGVALMSVGNILFLAVVVLANWVTTRLYLM